MTSGVGRSINAVTGATPGIGVAAGIASGVVASAGAASGTGDATAAVGSVGGNSFLLREDGSFLLREDGSKFILETLATNSSFLLREDGSFLLREDGSKFILEDGAGGLGIVKIMPLGDSITQGQNTSYGSYRRLLYSLLTTDGINVDFVGSLSDGTFADPQHEGHTGEEIVSIWARVATAHILLTYTPDIILLIIGTNDIWHGADPSPSTALNTLNSLLGSITAERPSAITLVGSIPPMDAAAPGIGSTVSSNVNVYNAGIPAVVAANGSKFIFVDINAGLTTADLADGVHPTDAGNDKIARLWEPAILAALGQGFGHLLDGSSVILTDDSGNNLLAG